MFIGVVLLCQAYFACLISFQVLNYIPFVPDSEDSSEFESFSSDNEAANAEAAKSGRDEDRANSPSRSEGTRADHPTSTRSAARKRSSSSQTADNRYVASRL